MAYEESKTKQVYNSDLDHIVETIGTIFGARSTLSVDIKRYDRSRRRIVMTIACNGKCMSLTLEPNDLESLIHWLQDARAIYGE